MARDRLEPMFLYLHTKNACAIKKPILTKQIPKLTAQNNFNFGKALSWRFLRLQMREKLAIFFDIYPFDVHATTVELV